MILNASYPLLKASRKQLVLALVIALWVFLFLFLAEPFKIDRFSFEKKLWALPTFGFIQGISIVIALIYQQKRLKNSEVWRVQNELIYLVIVTLCSWLLTYLFYILAVTSGDNTYSFLNHARYHFLPGLLLILPVIVVLRYLSGYISNKAKPTEISIIHLKGDGIHDGLRIATDNLLFIQSQDNYLDVHYLENGTVQHKLIRGSLIKTERTFPHLLRTHRSFLINPDKFKEHTFVQKKLMLFLSSGCKVPVSESQKATVFERLGIL